MQKRTLGTQGLAVSAIGLGCMGMSEFYGATDEAESIATIHRALDLGVTLLDTADIYGYGENERLVGRALRGRRDGAVVASKFGIVRKRDDSKYRGVSGAPDYVRSSCEASLGRLGLEVIDLYYAHRIDAGVPIEDTMGALGELVRQGKIRYVGLSNVSAQTLRRAHAAYPVSCVQNEYSLWSREVDDELLPAARALGIGFVPYSPLGRGFLSGGIRTLDDLAPDDFRRGLPRFQGENFARNVALADRVRQLAARKGCTPSQLALAWVLAQGADFVPIPGTKRRSYLEQNLAAAAIRLDADELAEIEAVSPRSAVAGTPYPDMSAVVR